MSDKSQEYLDILDRLIRMADDAKLAANAATTRGESGAACLLDYLTRVEIMREYGMNNVPDRWRVN